MEQVLVLIKPDRTQKVLDGNVLNLFMSSESDALFLLV